jgi:hypothetical protein
MRMIARAADEQAPRSDELRNAFNSPFWPHVLATTSVGQEGLDFHAWCSRILHWDLCPSPLELEQREGRIQRDRVDSKAFGPPTMTSGSHRACLVALFAQAIDLFDVRTFGPQPTDPDLSRWRREWQRHARWLATFNWPERLVIIIGEIAVAHLALVFGMLVGAAAAACPCLAKSEANRSVRHSTDEGAALARRGASASSAFQSVEDNSEGKERWPQTEEQKGARTEDSAQKIYQRL